MFSHFIKDPFSNHIRWIWAASFLFAGSLLVFKVLTFMFHEQVLMLFSEFFDDLQQLGIDVFSGPSVWRGVRILFFNNLRASLMMLLGGLVLILPFLGLVVNGGLVGIVSALVSIEGSMSLFGFYVVGILPHGLFEIPAIILSAAIGLKVSKEILSPPNNESRGHRLKKNYMAALQSLPVIVILLVIAAFLEVFLTPVLMDLYL